MVILYLLLTLLVVFINDICFYLSLLIVWMFVRQKRNKPISSIDKDKDTAIPAKRKKSLYEHIRSYLNDYVRYVIIKIGRIHSFRIRTFIYRKVLYVDMPKDTVVYYGAEIRSPYTAQTVWRPGFLPLPAIPPQRNPSLTVTPASIPVPAHGKKASSQIRGFPFPCEPPFPAHRS